mgnify:CR=1 FL=1
MANVLVVDDDRTIRMILSEILTTEGYTVKTAEHGGPALDILRASQERLVVLLGLVMPYVDGQEVLEAVAMDEALASRHAIVMVTAQVQAAQTGRIAELRKQLDVPLIAKPFTVKEILSAVETSSARLDE